MKQKLLLGAGLAACALAWAAKDPIVMTVNGVDVPKSEFEYLYHKNSQQQVTAQPLETYADMFMVYKLKVADAKAMGIDTTSAFRKEMEQYRTELAAPYLTDSTVLNRLVDEAYERSRNEVVAQHIMLMKGRGAADNAKSKALLDSIRGVVKAGKATFEDMAKQYSADRQSAENGGSMGFITANRLPYNFELAAYTLKPGEISGIVESPMAYHILKGGERRAARGQVLASHIMKMVPPTATEAEQAKAKQVIDSLYNIVKAAPNRFEEIAMANSDDPGSAKKGGLLPWFGTGMMVPEFDAESFRLGIGEVSEPVRTRYGWHIIMKINEKGPESKAQMRPALLQRITNPQDERAVIIRDAQGAKFAKKHKAKLNDKAVSALRARIASQGLDSAFYAQPDMVIGKIGKQNLQLSGLLEKMRGVKQDDPEAALSYFNTRLDGYFYSALVEAETEWLERNEPEYRNLLGEYRDGSLLFEASRQKVWDKAAQDTEGLERYFDAHRSEYTWTDPKVKGLLVQTRNDSVAALVKARYPQLGGDTVVSTLRKEFGKDIAVDRILMSKGQNPMVDVLVFGETKAAKPSVAGFTEYFILDPVMLSAPQEMADVRGQVTSDYQAELEKAWVDELRAKYPVSINRKNLNKVK